MSWGRGAAQGWRGASETVSWRWGFVLGTKAMSDTVCFTLSEQVCNSKNCGGQEGRWVNTKDTIPVIFVSQRGRQERGGRKASGLELVTPGDGPDTQEGGGRTAGS